MKFVIRNDTYYVVAKKKIFLLVYLCCLLLVSFFLKSQTGNEYSFVKSVLGIWAGIDSNIIAKIFLVYSFFVYIYLGYDLFLKDLRFSYGNIFSRLNKKTWVISKIISIFLITWLIKIITYLLLFIIAGTNCGLYSYILNLLFTWFWQLLFLIGYIICFKSHIGKILVLFGSLILILVFSFFPQLLMSDFYSDFVLGILSVLLLGIYLIVSNKNINSIVERSLV